MSVPTSLRVGIAEPTTVDPARVDSPSALLVVAQAFDGLVATLAPDGRLRAAAAERWTFDGSGRVITFTLRRGMRFHNGRPVRAQDFAYAWERVADPLTRSPFSFLLEPVAGYEAFHVDRTATSLSGVRALDDRRLRVTLVEPRPGFVAVAAHPALSPVPPEGGSLDFDVRPAGNGPYRMTADFGLGQAIQLERFPGYYGQAPAIDRLVFEVYAQLDGGWPDFLAGELDISQIPSPVVPDAEAQFGSQGIVTLARVLYCGFNLRLDRYRDARLRRAFSLALDRDTIASDVYGGRAVPASGIVPPTIPGHDPAACGDHCARDVPRAADLTSEVPEDRRRFRLNVISTDIAVRLAQAVVSQVAEAGLEVEPEPIDEEAFTRRLQDGTQQAFCLVWDADTLRQEAFLDPLLASGSLDNHTGVDNAALDTALEEARGLRREGDRREAYRKAEALALNLLPLVPVVWFRSHLAVQPYVEGFALDPLGLYDVSAMRLLAPETPVPGPSPSIAA